MKKRRENPKYENGFLTLGYGYLGNDEKKNLFAAISFCYLLLFTIRIIAKKTVPILNQIF